MIVADSHEFLELYRGDKDVRVGIEMVNQEKGLKFISFAPDAASPIDQERFGKKYLSEIGLPELPSNFELELLPSCAIRFKKKATGGICSLMHGYSLALKRAMPDIILENPFAWLTPRSYQTYRFSKKHSIPVVYYDPGDDIPISLKHRVMAKWESPIVQHASAIITYNEVGRDRFVKKYAYPSEKIHVIPKPVDVESCRYDGDTSELRMKYGANADSLIVGYIGRLASYKGSNVLLEAARIAESSNDLNNIKFVFIGGSLSSSESEDDYRLSNTYVTGMIPHDDVARYTAACDVLVFPGNDSGFGGFATSVAEAMAAGKAIMFGTKKPGYYVPFKDGVTAKLIEPSSPMAIVEGLLKGWPSPPGGVFRQCGKRSC